MDCQRIDVVTTYTGHPSEPETFEFTQTSEKDGARVVIKSYVAYDSRWPWWRKLWAGLGWYP